MPKEPPVELDNKGDRLSASQKLESDLLLVRSQIEANGSITGETTLKFMTDYHVKPAELAQILWYVILPSLSSSSVPTIPFLQGGVCS